MKKYIVIGLIVLVGGVLLIKPLLNNDDPIDNPIIKIPKAALFAFQQNLKTRVNETVTVDIQINKDNISTLDLFFNDSILKTWGNPKEGFAFDLNTNFANVGASKIELVAHLDDGTTEKDMRMIRLLSDIIPEVYTVKIIKSYPHNTTQFTQGLEFYNGKLFESTGDPGQRGATLVAEIDLTTGEINPERKMGLDASHFGEGITILNDVIYQLTWKNQKCITYDLGENIVPKSEFYYTGEGWGLTNDGTSLIMSDGSERITFRNPETFAIERFIEVYSDLGPITNLNELEYFNGKIYANIWTSNTIISIDPETGKILEEIDASELQLRGKGMYGEVLNGIAYNSETGKIYMTGKNWFQLFEVQFEKL